MLDYRSSTIETYHDNSTEFYDTSYDKAEFDRMNLSVFGSVGVDYRLSGKMYLGISAFYNNMFDPIKGRETFWGNHYTVKIDDLGVKLRLGYAL